MAFLEVGLLKLKSNILRVFKSGALRTITNNITRSMINWKKEFLHRCISKTLFIDTEQFSKMYIFLHVFFKDYVYRFRTTYLKNGFIGSHSLQRVFIPPFSNNPPPLPNTILPNPECSVCWLLWLNPGALGEHLTSQLSWSAA